MSLSAFDLAQLQHAIDLAHGAIGLSDPNPRVGCVLRDAQGALAGTGHTQQAGGPHAEVMALREAQSQGRTLTGGTAWVSLEPCAHHGRTPPCADALVAAGLARVVVATSDPFEQVAGQGIARLRAAGITVDLAEPGPLVQAARELNIGFFSRIQRGRPWVRMKVAASLDGRTALPDGRSQWITGAAARADGHAWRRRAGALLTGIGTVRDDDPRLDVREVPTARQPRRVVVDSQFQTPVDARLFEAEGGVTIVGAQDQADRMAGLRQRGADVLLLPQADGRVDLTSLLQHLARQGVNELHVEAGATLNAALLLAGLVDEVLLYLAPKLLGPGRDIAALPVLPALDQALTLDFTDLRPLGPDVRLMARVSGHADFLAG